MNIFYTYSHPTLAARIQHDRHVVKMISESVQMLSTAIQVGLRHIENDEWTSTRLIAQAYQAVAKSFPDSSVNKPAYENHPSTQWARENSTNFAWLTCHAWELLAEYRRRFPDSQHGKFENAQRIIYLCGAMSSRLHDNAGFLRKDSHPTIIELPWCVFKSKLSWELLNRVSRHDPPPFCGPEQYRSLKGDAKTQITDSYRDYYLHEKVQGNRWTLHSTLQLPAWLDGPATIHTRPDKTPKVTRRSRKPMPVRTPDLSELANRKRVKLGRIKL